MVRYNIVVSGGMFGAFLYRFELPVLAELLAFDSRPDCAREVSYINELVWC